MKTPQATYHASNDKPNDLPLSYTGKLALFSGLLKQAVSRWLAALNNYLPKPTHFFGLGLVLIMSLLSLWLNTQLVEWSAGKLTGLSSLTIALLIGMLLGNSLYPRFAKPLAAGVNFSKGQILRLAIVLYGFKITLTQLASVGTAAIVIDALVLSSTFIITYLLGTKWLKMDKTTTLLIGSGASICGAAAVIATEPVVKADSHKVTIAVATVVVFGTLSMLLYPLLYQLGWLSGLLNTQQYGVYTGSTIHEVAQVVVAGNAVSMEVGNTAVVTKMIRVMMLAPFLLILSIILTSEPKLPSVDARSADPSTPTTQQKVNQSKPLLWLKLRRRLKQVHVPWFAFVFIAMVGVNSVLALSSGHLAPIAKHITQIMIGLDNLLLTMAMFALGLTTHFSAIKQAGIKPLILGGMMFGWLILGGAGINILITGLA